MMSLNHQYVAALPLYALRLLIGTDNATACLSLLIAIYFSLPSRLSATKSAGGKRARVNA